VDDDDVVDGVAMMEWIMNNNKWITKWFFIWKFNINSNIRNCQY
jgi:hypothetical protein